MLHHSSVKRTEVSKGCGIEWHTTVLTSYQMCLEAVFRCLENNIIYTIICMILFALLIREVHRTLTNWSHLTDDARVGPISGNRGSVQRAHVATQVGDEASQTSDGLQANQCRLTAGLVPPVTPTCNGVAGSSVKGSTEILRHNDPVEMRQQIAGLQVELEQCRQTIDNMRDTERRLRDRFSEVVQNKFDNGCDRFEDVNLESNRPTMLIRQYNDLYSEERLNVLDALDQLPGIALVDQVKNEILFTVVVLCFEAAERSVRQLKDNIRCMLVGLPDSHPQSLTQEHIPNTVERLLQNVDNAVSIYLRKTTLQRDVTADVKLVRGGLNDYPSLKDCKELDRFTSSCFQLAWSLAVQNPRYTIQYNCVGEAFTAQRHARFHASDPDGQLIKDVVWPGLVEQSSDVYVCKAIVVT